MKKSLILIALAMVVALSMVSCKNNNKTKEPTQEEVQEQKQALADSVLAKIDEFAAQYIGVSDKADILSFLNLSEEEKLVKPDYLLDPGEAYSLTTEEQKINALAIYELEYFVRYIYDMPTDKVKEAIAKLAVDVNHPTDVDFFLDWDKSISEEIKKEYELCKERGDVAYFWQFEKAILCETDYLVAKNPELYLRTINEDNYNAWNKQWLSFYRAALTLAPYDDDLNMIIQSVGCKTDEEFESCLVDFHPEETIINTYKNNKYQFIERRNALLQ